MANLKDKLLSAGTGALAGAGGLIVARGCNGNCTSCYGCLLTGAALLLFALIRNRKEKKSKKDFTPSGPES